MASSAGPSHPQDHDYQTPTSLEVLDSTKPHRFVKPEKKINEGHHVPHFLMSQAYRDIGIFVMQLNIAMCPRRVPDSDQVQSWRLDSQVPLSVPVRGLRDLVLSIDAIIDEVPPDTTGPRRFGNSSFREWFSVLESRVRYLLETHLSKAVLEFKVSPESQASVLEELMPYLMGSLGSPERLDYGTGHELSFLAFLGCIWKLGGFSKEPSQDDVLGRSIVTSIIEPYLRFIRRLIVTYTLEPAGSHGVWGLDDHFFLSYIFGSAQYCPAIKDGDAMPREGFLPGSPSPGDIVKKAIVERERNNNMYFSAVGFINDVKTGPFWEHSPILFDISGVRAGWGKINKGMIKMYNAEVLSKFPVVQHFPFGSLFRWDQDPNAEQPALSAHASSHPIGDAASTSITRARPPHSPHEPTRPLWGATANAASVGPAAPWAQVPTRSTDPPARAPWNTRESGQFSTRTTGTGAMPPPSSRPTRAPWVNQKGSGT